MDSLCFVKEELTITSFAEQCNTIGTILVGQGCSRWLDVSANSDGDLSDEQRNPSKIHPSSPLWNPAE
jgi:hypothetical protein